MNSVFTDEQIEDALATWGVKNKSDQEKIRHIYLGLLSEWGEMCGLINKREFKAIHFDKDNIDNIVMEMGDISYYLRLVYYLERNTLTKDLQDLARIINLSIADLDYVFDGFDRYSFLLEEKIEEVAYFFLASLNQWWDYSKIRFYFVPQTSPLVNYFEMEKCYSFCLGLFDLTSDYVCEENKKKLMKNGKDIYGWSN